MPISQTNFSSVQASLAADKLPEGAVATATNIDFSIEPGAATVRRGCTKVNDISVGNKIRDVYRHYNNPTSIGSSPIYATTSLGEVYRNTTQIATGGANELNGITSYRQYAYIASGTNLIKDDGAATTDWIKQQPAALTVSVSTLAPLSITATTNTFSISEGGMVGSPPAGTATFTQNTGSNRGIAVMTLTGPKDLNINSGNTIGDFGIHYTNFSFTDPKSVYRIIQDFSVGDADFSSFYRSIFYPQDTTLADAQANVETLIESQLNVGNTTINVDGETRDQMSSDIREENRPPVQAIALVPGSLVPLAIPRTDFEFIGKYSVGDNPWTKCYAYRVIVECTNTTTNTIIVTDPEIRGAENFPLNDVNVGYSYWETWATFDASNNFLGESAPSPGSDRLKMQNSRAVIVSTSTPSGAHGVTHRIFYRQGGYMADSYAIGTVTLGTATFTDTMNDIQALSLNQRMPRDIIPKGSMPGFQTISEPFFDQIFGGYLNRIKWSLPGRPDAFPRTADTAVSHTGDEVQKLIVWPPGLVIVNRDSVYEMHGSTFHGRNQDWILQRSGARRGSVAPHTIVKTPHGIPLLNYDGLSFYVPGQGVDQSYDWISGKLLDVFKGSASTDPGGLKGIRVPVLNRSYIRNSCACFAADKYYLALPTGSSQDPNTVFVIDFLLKDVYWYTYPFTIYSLFWDFVDNRVLAGTTDGRIMWLEDGTVDTTTSGGSQSITWRVKTKEWTTTSDTVAQNLHVEYQGANAIAYAVWDVTGTQSIGTLTSSYKDWLSTPMNGVYQHNIAFEFLGTRASGSNAALYNLSYENLPDPQLVRYFKTPHETAGTENEKMWDYIRADVEMKQDNYGGTSTGTIVTFVDNVAVMTSTIVGPNLGRTVYRYSFPAETYGNVAYSTYTSTQNGMYFKIFDHSIVGRPEPPRINFWKSEVQSLDENICDGFDTDINPNGSVVAVCYVDNTAITTSTLTGSQRQSFTSTIPAETYGRTIYVTYTGTGFKHYNTWFHLRPEPDRWSSFVSDRISENEKEYKRYEVDFNALGGTALSTVYTDGTAVGTYTLTGTGRQSYVFSLPAATFARTIWARYTAQGNGKFKHFNTWFEGQDEPDRVTLHREGPVVFPSNQNLKTWLVDLDPLGGTVYGTLIVDGVAITTGTFTGSNYHKYYTVGLDVNNSLALQTGSQLDIRYSAATPFKHYRTDFETEAKPFGKTTWAWTYRKIGGASALDMGRFWEIDAEVDAIAGTSTVVWDVDAVPVSTYTIVHSGRNWQDRISFPPGIRGYLFQARVYNPTGIRVFSLGLDVAQEGVKGLTRRVMKGTPEA